MTAGRRTTALLVDDEKLLVDELRRLLAAAWPELVIVGEAGSGPDALTQAAALDPDVIFLDIQMPGMNGLDVARRLGAAAHVVFVTAYDQYAVRAFDEGAVDYVLKPVEEERLARTVERLRSRLATPPPDLGEILQRLGLQTPAPRQTLQWLQVGDGQDIRILPIGDVCVFQSADKYTLVRTAAREWVIRTPLKELEDELDAEQFWRVHRNTIVRVGAIESASRDLTGRVTLRVHGLLEPVAVSRAYAHRFRQR